LNGKEEFDTVVDESRLRRKTSDKLINISNQLNVHREGENNKKVVKKIEDVSNSHLVKKKITSNTKKSNNRNEKSPITQVEKSNYTLSRERSRNLEDKSKSPYKINNTKFINKKM